MVEDHLEEDVVEEDVEVEVIAQGDHLEEDVAEGDVEEEVMDQEVLLVVVLVVMDLLDMEVTTAHPEEDAVVDHVEGVPVMDQVALRVVVLAGMDLLGEIMVLDLLVDQVVGSMDAEVEAHLAEAMVEAEIQVVVMDPLEALDVEGIDVAEEVRLGVTMEVGEAMVVAMDPLEDRVVEGMDVEVRLEEIMVDLIKALIVEIAMVGKITKQYFGDEHTYI
jgi:hypothetical protein